MLDALISAGSNIIGGIMGSRAQDKNIKLQKEFAQHGIRWKVEDAKAAGLHPLAALGAQTSSFSPVSVGTDLSSGIAAAGGDISRAINATRSSGERIDAYTKTLRDLQLQRAGLENQLLASQIAKVNQAGTPPPLPGAGDRFLVEGQANSPLVSTGPLTRMASDPSAPHSEAGAVAELGFGRTPTGWAPMMSKDAKDRLEEDPLGMLAWNMRNRIIPTLNVHGGTPPSIQKDPDEYWVFDPARQEYRLMKPTKKRSWMNTWQGPYHR